MPPNSPLLAKLGPIIARMFETGIIAQNSRFLEIKAGVSQFSFSEIMDSQARSNKQQNTTPLNIVDHLLGSLYLLGIGWGAATVAFAGELIVFKLAKEKEKRNQLKQEEISLDGDGFS